jgi:hypothetical protein
MTLFNIAYAVISEDSAECGDVEESGMVDTGLNLRDAVAELFRTRTNEVGGIEAIEANCYPLPASGWLEFAPAVTVYNGMEFRTGEQENRSLIPCGRITAASWGRIVRMVKGR